MYMTVFNALEKFYCSAAFCYLIMMKVKLSFVASCSKSALSALSVFCDPVLKARIAD